LKLLLTPHVEHFTIGLTMELAKYCDVTLLSTKRYNIKTKQVIVPDLPVVGGFLKRILCKIYPLLYDMFHANTSVEGVLVEKHDKLVVTEHSLADPNLAYGIGSKKYYEAERDALIRLYDQGVPMITPSNYSAKMLLKKYGVKVSRVIYHGLLDEFRAQETREPSQKPVILWSAELIPIKEPIVFIDALAKVHSKIDFKAVVRGEGPLYKAMTKRIQENKLWGKVVFVRRMPFERLPLLYKSSTLFVHTSSYEPFGFVVLEAMGSGLPVIVPRNGGAYEVAGSGAVTFNPHDASDFAEKILSIVSDVDTYCNQSKRSLERAKAFTWAKAAQEYIKVYNSLLF